MKKHLLFALGLLSFLILPLFGETDTTPGVLYQWQGTTSRYPGQPPYLLIRDQDDLSYFWKIHSPKEEMPSIDFDKNMVFVYCAGPKMTDFVPMKAIRFFKGKASFTILLALDKTIISGRWRNPYIVALLPKTPRNLPIYVMKKGDELAGDPPQIPLYSFSHLGGAPISRNAFAKMVTRPKIVPPPFSQEPDKPVLTAEAPLAGQPQTGKTPVVKPVPAEPPKAVPPTTPRPEPAKPVKPIVQAALPKQPPPVAKPPVADAFGAGTAEAKSKAAETKAPQKTKPADDDLFGSIESSAPAGKKAEAATKPAPTAPPAKSDPLNDPFQDQFNIEF